MRVVTVSFLPYNLVMKPLEQWNDPTEKRYFHLQCPLPDKCPLILQLEEKEKEIARLTEENKRLAMEIERLTGKNNKYADMLFGRSSEKTARDETNQPEEKAQPIPVSPEVPNESTPDAPLDNLRHLPRKRNRGAQPGHKGHGRKIPEELPVLRVEIKVPEDQRSCATCGQEHDPVPFTENSTQVEVRVELFRVEYVRERLKRTCNCDGSRFITAPRPPQAIEKSKFSHNLLSLLVVLKYIFALPLQRALTILGMQGATLSSGSVTGAFKRLLELLIPLYQSLAAVSRKEGLWNVDETGWMSFIRRPEKSNFLAWMWVFASPKVILYIFDPSRSSKVPLAHLGEKVRGFLVADRFSAYSKLAKMIPELVVSVCWAHFRRDFINAGKSFQQLQPWVDLWKKRIAEIYRLNRRRLESKESEAQRELEEAINKMAGDIAAELTNPNLHYKQRRVLTSAQKHWPGLTVFVRHPEVPMDNNRAERALRRIALGRKNYFGFFADWSSLFAAVCLTVLQTAILHGLNPVAYLRYYLDACAAAGGVPEHLERFHPWNIPDDVLMSYKMRGAKRA